MPDTVISASHSLDQAAHEPPIVSLVYKSGNQHSGDIGGPRSHSQPTVKQERNSEKSKPRDLNHAACPPLAVVCASVCPLGKRTHAHIKESHPPILNLSHGSLLRCNHIAGPSEA